MSQFEMNFGGPAKPAATEAAPAKLEAQPPQGDDATVPSGEVPEIVATELDITERVLARLDAAPPDERGARLRGVERDLQRLAELMRDRENTEDYPTLLQQWNRQSALLKQLRTSHEAPKVDPSSPYFGHLRLSENGKEHDILLGRASDIVGDLPIVDWRHAPVAKIFYRYRQGEDYDEEIAGRDREGEVVARRTVSIRDRRLERVEAPEGTFTRAADGWRAIDVKRSTLGGGEGGALRAHQPASASSRRLGTTPGGARHQADKHLPDVAGLLDPEQFRLIARPDAGFVVVRGAAGSGKTTVALHRIAWLAYADPGIDSERTLFVVFSPALREYVSHVLPSLGVNRVRVSTFPDWARQATRRVLPRLPRERRDDAPAVVQSIKTHPAMLTALERQVRENPAAGDPAQVIDDWGSVLSHADRLTEIFEQLAPGDYSVDQLRTAAEWCRVQHEHIVASLENEDGAEPEIHAEDDPLLLRAWQLRIGPLPMRYRHVAIDEVQDLSPTEVRVLIDCLDSKQSLTLAGDTQQHVSERSGFTSWTQFFEDLGLVGTELSTLDISYRCTAPIARFAADVLGDLREGTDLPQTTKDGPPVELFRFHDMGECVAFLADALTELVRRERLASVALLSPSVEVGNAVYDGLVAAEVPGIRRVRHYDFTFQPGVEVAEIDQAKGLEFDYVIVLEANRTRFPDTPSARRLLHVGATRAIHQLWLTSVGTPTALIPS